ncbi:MAG: FGGY family carbohydrate kinase [Verrucomicrobiota bacterium]
MDTTERRTKAVALDLELAAVVAEGRAEHVNPVGGQGQDPASWISSVDRAVRQCVGRLGEGRGRVAGIGVSGQSGGLVVLDERNRILGPACLPGERGLSEDSEELSQAFGGPPGLIELTGNAMRTENTASFLYALKKRFPDRFAAVTTALLPHDFLNFWLTGEKRMEFGDASSTGLMDVRTRSWSGEVLDFLDSRLRECLPPLCSSRGAQGLIRKELAQSWGLGGHVLVSAGGGRAMMEAIGAGNVVSGGVTVSLGRTGRLSGVSGEPLVDPRGMVSSFCDGTDQWMPMVMSAGATDPLEMVGKAFGWKSEDLEQAVAYAPGGAEGLMFLNQGSAGGVLHGIERSNYTPMNLARAAAEGVAMEFGHGLQRIMELGFRPEQVHVAGDWSRSRVWRQLVSDVLGLPVAAAKAGDGAALGAALQSAITYFAESGENLTYQEIAAYAAEPVEGTSCEPVKVEHERYRDLLSRRQFLSESLRGSGLN